jgi:signal peptidase I
VCQAQVERFRPFRQNPQEPYLWDCALPLLLFLCYDIHIMAGSQRFFDLLQSRTETCLTHVHARKRIKREKQRRKNPILDWLEAFIWAAGVVLLINQYLFQAYQIPSGSMIDTLLGGLRNQGITDDRIFVNKLIYGPELLPGLGKLPSPVKPRREDVIIFENPEYLSRGPVFDIAQRIIYMLTLSFVDIDRDASGNPKVHFLIKRAAGMGGDRIESRKGELFIRFAGEDRWVPERDWTAARGFRHKLSRLIQAEDYPAIEAVGKMLAYQNMGIQPPEEVSRAAASARADDTFARDHARLRLLQAAHPHNERYRALAAKTVNWYVPEGRILPLGDNRDNSKDGRYFGPVKVSKILGKGSVIYWPLKRIHLIK